MKISVITVCYQAALHLGKTLNSVMEQTCSDFEYIVVDGGSTDGSLELIQEFRKKEMRRRIVLLSEPDRGIYDAMNKGVRLCCGEYVIFINAGDCFADRDVLQKMIKRADPIRPDILYGDLYDCNFREWKQVCYQNVKINSWFFLMSKMICHQVIFSRKEWLEKYPFDINYRYAADRKWLIQCVKKKAVLYYVPVVVSVYDRTGTSSVETNFEQVRDEIDRCLLEEYPVRGKMLQIIKNNRCLRQWVRRRIFQKN